MWEYVLFGVVLVFALIIAYDMGKHDHEVKEQKEMNEDQLIGVGGYILDYNNSRKDAIIYCGTSCLWTVSLVFVSNEVRLTRNSGKSGDLIDPTEAQLLAKALDLVSYKVKGSVID